MDKLRELRIGNLIQDEGTIYTVSEISMMGIDCFNDKDSFGDWIVDAGEDEFEFIPLTEDWLIKLGFFEKYGSCYNRLNIKLFTLIDSEDDDGNLKGEFIFDGTLEVKYVHQLQNLYFALTNGELKYNG